VDSVLFAVGLHSAVAEAEILEKVESEVHVVVVVMVVVVAAVGALDVDVGVDVVIVVAEIVVHYYSIHLSQQYVVVVAQVASKSGGSCNFGREFH
jgi:Mg2+/citrate symporter